MSSDLTKHPLGEGGGSKLSPVENYCSNVNPGPSAHRLPVGLTSVYRLKTSQEARGGRDESGPEELGSRRRKWHLNWATKEWGGFQVGETVCSEARAYPTWPCRCVCNAQSAQLRGQVGGEMQPTLPQPSQAPGHRAVSAQRKGSLFPSTKVSCVPHLIGS